MQQGRVASIPNVTSLLAAFFAISLVGGVLTAALAIPLVAAGGATVRSGVGIYDALPAELKSVVPRQQTVVFANDGKTQIATLYNQNRIVVQGNQIAPMMRKAQVAIEDKRFYEHGGIDLQGVGAAVAGAAAGGEVRGASTLTQQYVKQTLLQGAIDRGDSNAAKAAVATNMARKLQELKYAVEVEKVKSKDQILTEYLNLVYFGDQAYGVEAAARHYFSVHASQLTIPQAATLAGLVQQPGAADPIHHPEAALKRRNTVLLVMKQQGIIDAGQYQRASASPLGVKPSYPKSTCSVARYPYFCDFLRGWVQQQPVFGKSANERWGNFVNGGYHVVTTLDPGLQDEAQADLNRRVASSDYPKWGSAAVTTEVGTGKIRAMVQSSTYSLTAKPGATGVNWAVDSIYGGGGGFHVGSTMKAFAVAQAMQDGLGSDYYITGIRPAPAYWYPGDFSGCGPVGGPWVVHNTEGDENVRSMSLRDATRNSVNTAFVRLVQKLGACNVRDMESKFGIHLGRPYKDTDGTYTDKMISAPAAITLGATNISPMTMSLAYATFGNGGAWCPMTPVESITDSFGKKVDLHLPGCKQVVSKRVADETAGVLQSVLTDGTGKDDQLAGGRPAAGKTGTDDMAGETWFVGTTPQYSTAVWVGTPDGDDPSGNALNSVALNGVYYGKLQGYKVAGKIWQSIMNDAHSGLPVEQFGQNSPATTSNAGDQTIPDVSGMTVSQATSTLQQAGFTVGIGRRASSSGVSRGLVVYTTPNGSAAQGSQVLLHVSRGYGGTTSTGTGTTTRRRSTSSGTTTTTKMAAAASATKAAAAAAPAPSASP